MPSLFQSYFLVFSGALMLDAAKLRRRIVLRSWLATMYIVDGQGSATARGTRRHVGGVHIVFVGGVHCAYCGCVLCLHCA